MPIITGNAYDVGLTPIGNAVAGKVVCRIETPSRSQVGIHFTKDVTVSCSETGEFSIVLPDYSGNPTPVLLSIGVRWSNQNGYASGIGFTEWSWLPAVQAPNVDIELTDLLERQFGNDLVYVGPDAPTVNESTGFQLNTTTWELYERVGF